MYGKTCVALEFLYKNFARTLPHLILNTIQLRKAVTECPTACFASRAELSPEGTRGCEPWGTESHQKGQFCLFTRDPHQEISHACRIITVSVTSLHSCRSLLAHSSNMVTMEPLLILFLSFYSHVPEFEVLISFPSCNNQIIVWNVPSIFLNTIWRKNIMFKVLCEFVNSIQSL